MMLKNMVKQIKRLIQGTVLCVQVVNIRDGVDMIKSFYSNYDNEAQIGPILF